MKLKYKIEKIYKIIIKDSAEGTSEPLKLFEKDVYLVRNTQKRALKDARVFALGRNTPSLGDLSVDVERVSQRCKKPRGYYLGLDGEIAEDGIEKKHYAPYLREMPPQMPK